MKISDQSMMNILFHSGKYKSKILDPIDGNVFYGPSANMWTGGKNEYIETEKDPRHIIEQYGINGWQSWREIKYKNKEFWLYGKKVKLLHHCGGGNPEITIKVAFDIFDSKIIPILQKITKCKE